MIEYEVGLRLYRILYLSLMILGLKFGLDFISNLDLLSLYKQKKEEGEKFVV